MTVASTTPSASTSPLASPLASPETFPPGRQSLIVIHGIGNQRTYESLDGFTQGLVNHLTSQGITLQLEHCCKPRQNASGGQWVENYVRLQPQGNGEPGQSDRWIEIHEYYWAYLTEDKIDVDGVWDWIEQSLQGAQQHFEANRDNLAPLLSNKPYWYRLNAMLWRLRFIYPLIRLALALLPQWSSLLRKLRSQISNLGTQVIVDFMGDIAVYTSTEQKSRYYQTREHILEESLALLESVLQEDESDRVVVLGHSLGSVIAYDTLNRLNLKLNREEGSALATVKTKLMGLVTFGSPLDKIAFFFRERANQNQYVRRQILQHLNSFRLKLLDRTANPYTLSNPIRSQLDQVTWVNYYDNNDPISGRLDLYQIDPQNNVEMKSGKPWGQAHNAYWDTPDFYADIYRRLLIPAADDPDHPPAA